MKKLLPGGVLIVALSIDQINWLGASVVPLACVFAMVVYSFILTFRQMIVWAAIYIVAIVGTLWFTRSIWSGGDGNAEALVVTRTLVACAAGVLACLMAKRRERETITQKAIYQILDQMRVPVFASNQDGWLIHLNKEAKALLGGSLAIQTPFFELFAASSAKGVAIRTYVDLATGAMDGPVTIDLALSPDRSQVHQAIMLRLDLGDRMQVITILSGQQAAPKPTQLTSND